MNRRLPPYPVVLRWLWRELRIMIFIALASTFIFNSFSGGDIGTNLIYAFCATFCIQALIEAGRYGLPVVLPSDSPLRFSFGSSSGFSARLSRQPAAGHPPVGPDAQHPHDPAPDSLAPPRTWPGWPLMEPWVTMSVVVGYLAGHALADVITGSHQPLLAFVRNTQNLWPTLAPSIALAIGFTYFFYSRGRLAATEASAQAALRMSAESQLKLLVSQLEPHMLFNTLANLRVLIGQDPPRAQAMLDHLNGFLRATLDASRSDTHALAAEFARLDDYLELMQVRMGPRLRGTLDLPADLSGLPVPPLLLQPLVENSIKHGLEPSVTGGQIEIAARRDGEALVLSVRDTGVGLGAAAAHGSRFGMQQVRDRLAALYGDAASLELTTPVDGRGGALAVVRLPVA